MAVKYDYMPKDYEVGKDGLLYHKVTGELYQTRKSEQSPTLPGVTKPAVDSEDSKKGKGKKIV